MAQLLPIPKSTWNISNVSGASFPSGGYAISGTLSGVSNTQGPASASYQGTGQIPASVTVTKQIKIPWKMYKLSDIKGDLKKSLSNAKVIGNAIMSWWANSKNWAGTEGKSLNTLDGVIITYIDLVIDTIPIEIDGKVNLKYGILPIASFKTIDVQKVKDNDFIFSGTMKISKSDPDELVSVQIDGMDVIAGKYEIK